LIRRKSILLAAGSPDNRPDPLSAKELESAPLVSQVVLVLEYLGHASVCRSSICRFKGFAIHFGISYVSSKTAFPALKMARSRIAIVESQDKAETAYRSQKVYSSNQ
jgi:hypothetical protein